jgi:hypothetical protein
MRWMKRTLLIIGLIWAAHTAAVAQDEAGQPRVTLDFSEQCNNFLRHYCVAGNHEAAVNQVLLTLKERGTNITVKLIKQVARRTPSKVYIPPAPPE